MYIEEIMSYLMSDGGECFSGDDCDVDGATPVTLPVLDDGLDVPVPTANAVAGCRADTQVKHWLNHTHRLFFSIKY